MTEPMDYVCERCQCTSVVRAGVAATECAFCDHGTGADERWVASVPTTSLLGIVAHRDAFAITKIARGAAGLPLRLDTALRDTWRRPDAAGYVWRLAQAEIDRRVPPRSP